MLVITFVLGVRVSAVSRIDHIVTMVDAFCNGLFVCAIHLSNEKTHAHRYPIKPSPCLLVTVIGRYEPSIYVRSIEFPDCVIRADLSDVREVIECGFCDACDVLVYICASPHSNNAHA